jgi:hypothetical protein
VVTEAALINSNAKTLPEKRFFEWLTKKQMKMFTKCFLNQAIQTR